MSVSRCNLLVLLVLSLQAGAMEPNAVELELAQLIANHPDQERPELVYSPVLHLVARAKAIDLGMRDYEVHVDPDGYGPNVACVLAGWSFPSWYDGSLSGNNVESLTGGFSSASAAFNSWVSSEAHRAHLYGKGGYAAQTRYGLGHAYVPGSTYGHYYVFISAPPCTTGCEALEPYVEWLFGRYSLAEIHQQGDGFDGDRDGFPRILEFALNLDPAVADRVPAPRLVDGGSRLEWSLPVRSNLGTMQAVVKRSRDLIDWEEGGVSRSGNTFSIEVGGGREFLRCECSR